MTMRTLLTKRLGLIHLNGSYKWSPLLPKFRHTPSLAALGISQSRGLRGAALEFGHGRVHKQLLEGPRCLSRCRFIVALTVKYQKWHLQNGLRGGTSGESPFPQNGSVPNHPLTSREVTLTAAQGSEEIDACDGGR